MAILAPWGGGDSVSEENNCGNVMLGCGGETKGYFYIDMDEEAHRAGRGLLLHWGQQ